MNINKLYTPEETAEILGITAHTLAVWRCNKRYQLDYVKVGRLIRYREADIQKFIEDRLMAS